MRNRNGSVLIFLGLILFLLSRFYSDVLANAGPHGNYTVATDICATCHRTHTASSNLLISAVETGNAYCFTCHNGTGASVPPFASTHGNEDFSSQVEQNFQLVCTQCHDPHGHPTNLLIVRSDIRVQLSPLITTGPAIFTATTGPGSYDDGTSTVASRICLTCHVNTSNSGYPMVNHAGGANHAGGINYEGQNCITCHSHSSDTDINTVDGFMPSGGGCTGCHAATTGSLPRRAIVGANGDFAVNSERRSHHYVSGSGDPTDDQCRVCHDLSNHNNPKQVRVYDMDTGASLVLDDGINDAVEYEQFCLSCHDCDGVTSGAIVLPPGGSAKDPFADGKAPPDVSAGWAAASHNGSCIDCHDNGHGSNKLKLLGYWNYASTPDDDPYNEEEEFCFGCHGGIAGDFAQAINWSNAKTGTNSLANLNDRHDVQLSAQTVNGLYSALPNAVIECTDCHNVHAANSALMVIADPDTNDGRIPGLSSYFAGSNFMSDWCLDCHDGSMPAGVIDRHDDDSDPTTTDFPGLFDVFTYWNGDYGKDDTHGNKNGSVRSITADIASPRTQDEGDGWIEDIALQCLDCHSIHVGDVGGAGTNKTSLFQLKYPVTSRDGTINLNSNASTANGATPDMSYEYSHASVFISDNQNGYSWCNACHDGDLMQSGEANCARCHMHGTHW